MVTYRIQSQVRAGRQRCAQASSIHHGEADRLCVRGIEDPKVWDTSGRPNTRPSGAGTVKTKKGKYYSSAKLKGSTSRSGIYFSVVKGKTERIASAWLYFSGSMPIVMARGKYDSSTGKTKAFKFGKSRYPISKMNTKSVYWGVLHPKTQQLWSPETQQDYLNELNRQCQVILKMRP
jgi:hypothetical protein